MGQGADDFRLDGYVALITGAGPGKRGGNRPYAQAGARAPTFPHDTPYLRPANSQRA